MRLRPPFALLAAVLASLACAAAAAAASGGSVRLILTPDKASSLSSLSLSATGPFSNTSGQAKSLELQVQKGFSTSAKSVSVLCTAREAAADACPSKSQVGSGHAIATGTVLGFSETDTISLSLFLGARQRKGDVASVVIVGKDQLFHETEHATGRLFALRHGGLELLFDQLPTLSVPSGTTVTLDQLSLRAHAVRTVLVGKGRHRHRLRYSLIRNPRSCSKHWSARLKLAFESGSISRMLTTPCAS